MAQSTNAIETKTSCETCHSTDYEYIEHLPTYKDDYPMFVCNKCITRCRRCKQDLHPENGCYACAMGDSWAECDACNHQGPMVEWNVYHRQYLCGSSCAPRDPKCNLQIDESEEDENEQPCVTCESLDTEWCSWADKYVCWACLKNLD